MRGKFIGFMCFLVALLAGLAGHAGGVDIRPMWSVNLFTFLESGAALADIDLDGLDEVIVCGREELIALNGRGQELWRWRTPGRFMTWPAVLPRAGSAPLIYAADDAGHFSCVDGAGNLVWQAKLNSGSTWSRSALGDLDGDGATEVVQTDEGGNVWSFDALTGAAEWQSEVNGSPVTPGLGPHGEVAVATGKGMLFLLRGNGSPAWEKVIGGPSASWGTPGPAIFAAADGSMRIAAAGAEGRVSCFDEAGNLLWSRPTRGEMAATISMGDMDRDGRPEIFCVTQTGFIYRFTESGQLLWEIGMQGRTVQPGTVADIEGDGRMEYVLSTQSGRLLVLNDEGRFVFEHAFDNRTINVTPPFGELDAGVPGCELVITGGESGLVFCFSTSPVATAEAAPGAKFAITPENMTSELATGDPVRFRIDCSEITPGLRAAATCVRPDGSLQSALTPVLGSPARLILPIDFNTGGEYRFDWRLQTSAGSVLVSQQATLTIEPAANDRALVANTIQRLSDTAENLRIVMPLTRSALLKELAEVQMDLDKVAALQDAPTALLPNEARSILNAWAELLARARRAACIAELSTQAGTHSGLVAFEDVVWESRDVGDRVPGTVHNPLAISRRIVPGEHEPVAVNLFNLLDRDLHVRCVIDPVPEGFAATLLYAQASPTTQGEISWDALPELDESGVITIPPLSTRQLWLDVQAAAAAPGTHAIKLRLQAIDGAGVLEGPSVPRDATPPETCVDVSLNVLPFTMARSGAMRLCAWARLGDAEIADLLAHGGNVFCGSLPQAEYDAQGAYAGADYTALDKLVKAMNGEDVVLLLQGMPEFPQPREANAKRYFDELAVRLAGLGVDEQHFALYPIDEPSIHGWDGINKYVEFNTMVRAARPSIRLYMDGGAELPMFEAMDPVTDIWCVGINMLMEETPEMAFVRGTGDALWSYNCSYSHSTGARSSLKNTNIFSEYRTAALFAYRWNATGIGFWCYNIGADPWARTELDYPLVYPGRTKPVTSRRWEAVREGMEDMRILAALRQCASKTDDANVKAKIDHLLDVSLPTMLDRSWNEMRLGLNRDTIDASGNDQVLNEFRTDMLDCVEAVVRHD